uniref:Neurobeachin n=1 Tax=Laticauda laticaudata TaxID=8630 RepID=A0A8C5RP77_LATLA
AATAGRGRQHGGVSGGSGGGGGSGSTTTAGLRASGSGSVVLPAGMINPSVPIRNIRMKFAVLIGLIQVGEVSNRDIVETVLNLVRGLHPTSRGMGSPASLSP